MHRQGDLWDETRKHERERWEDCLDGREHQIRAGVLGRG